MGIIRYIKYRRQVKKFNVWMRKYCTSRDQLVKAAQDAFKDDINRHGMTVDEYVDSCLRSRNKGVI